MPNELKIYLNNGSKMARNGEKGNIYMWIIATWFVVALVVAMIFGSIARRSGGSVDREITTT